MYCIYIIENEKRLALLKTDDFKAYQAFGMLCMRHADKVFSGVEIYDTDDLDIVMDLENHPEKELIKLKLMSHEFSLPSNPKTIEAMYRRVDKEKA